MSYWIFRYDVFKSPGLNECHAMKWKDLSDSITEPLLVAFQNFCRSGEAEKAQKRINIQLTFEKGEKEGTSVL